MDRKNNGKKKIKWATNPIPLPLDQGDVICPQCNGDGFMDVSSDSGDSDVWEIQCNKCWGVGKLDWVERIMGKPNPNPHRTLKGNWTIETYEDMNALHSFDLEKDIVDAMALELSNKIDEEIVGNVIELLVTKSK